MGILIHPAQRALSQTIFSGHDNTNRIQQRPYFDEIHPT